MQNNIHVLCSLCKMVATFFVRSSDKLYPSLSGGFDLWKCLRCGALFISPIPQKEVLEEHYPLEYSPHAEFVGAMRKNSGMKAKILIAALAYWLGYGRKVLWQVIAYPYFLRIAHYPHFVEHGRVLDVGCGSGMFLWEMKRLGWREAIGIDNSKEAVQASMRHGLDARAGSILEMSFPSDYFEAITLHHVFEHLSDPRENLLEIKRVLKPGGELIITVPNTKSISARLFKEHWFGLEIPRHLINYNRHNLCAVIQEAGFSICSVRTPKILATFLGSVGYAFPRLFRVPQKLFVFVHRVLNMLEIGLDIMFVSTGLGDEIIVRARKPN